MGIRHNSCSKFLFLNDLVEILGLLGFVEKWECRISEVRNGALNEKCFFYRERMQHQLYIIKRPTGFLSLKNLESFSLKN